eukprot:TRINITY_DN1050_c0_g1_i1.p1 TRINITY_DN1050_c0_g1~~TRINITY_DN1050_c0_g1_i1.p1  ORF type:complete len:235 (+),score=29.90 TRINITY_DN1050_c0_g1_i1:134-838(+)
MINFAIKKCPSSYIWPQMLIHTEKMTFIDNFMKPCSKSSDCGIGVQCQGPLESTEDRGFYCDHKQMICDPPTCNCYNYSQVNQRNCKWRCNCPHGYVNLEERTNYCAEKSNKTYFAASKFISDTLKETRVFDQEICAKYAANKTYYSASNIGKVVKNKIMNFISKTGWGVDYSPIDNIKFCGLNNVSDETMSNFHRQTMDHLTQLTNTNSNRRSLLDDHESDEEDMGDILKFVL